MMERQNAAQNGLHRLGWMALLWSSSVLAMVILAVLIWLLMRSAGLVA